LSSMRMNRYLFDLDQIQSSFFEFTLKTNPLSTGRVD
jgi:hypothetical protein